MDKDALIDRLAEELGVSAVARKKWRQRGVPHKWRLPLLRKAAERGISLTDDAFEKQTACS
jgi:hypothetical protein